MAREFNVLALVKGEHYYVYVYDDDSRGALEDQFRRQAADPSLNFSPFDAAVLARKADEQVQVSPAPRF
jgi:hypothetical protein